MNLSWLGGSGDFAAAADWSPAQTPTSADDAMVTASGAYTVTLAETDAVHSLTVAAAGATVADNAELDLIGADASLTVQAGTFQLAANGKIVGGVISTAGAGAIAWDGGALDGVTYWGMLDLSAPAASLTVIGGLSLAGAAGVGPGELDLGASNRITLFDNQTIDGGVLNLAVSSGLSGTVDQSGAILSGADYQEQFITFGPNLTVNANSGFNVYFFDNGFGDLGLINQGTINQGANYSSVTAGSFQNLGTINASASYFEFYTNFGNSGSFKGTGANVEFNAGFAVTNAVGGVMSAQTGGFSFDDANVVNDGVITVDHGNLSLVVGPRSQYGNLTATNSSVSILGSLTTAQLLSWVGGGNDYVSIVGNLDNTGAAFGASPSQSIYSFVLGSTGQTTTVKGGVIIGNGGDTYTINTVFDGVTLWGEMGIGGPTEVLNGLSLKGRDGTGAGAVLIYDNSLLDLIDSQTLDNGKIRLAGVNATVALDITPTEWAASRGAGLAQTLTLGAGLWIDQTGQSGVLGAGATELGAVDLVNNGLIESDNGPLTLRGLSSVENAGSMLAQTGGSIVVQGATLTNTGAITVDAGSTFAAQTIANNATITLAGGTLHAANLTGSGQITGYGTVAIASGATRAVTASGGELDVYGAGPLASLSVAAGATLALEAASAATVGFSGAGVLKIAQPLAFTGSLGALADGATIDLVGLTATGPALIVGSSVQFATTGGLYTLNLGAAPTGAFTIQSDGAGGADLTYVAGTIATTNYGTQTAVARYASAGPLTSVQLTSQFGPSTVVQNFDGSWSQLSATITNPLANGSVLENFDGSWNRLSAVITQHPDADTTVVQTFTGSWSQTSATITTVRGNATEVQSFDGSWNQTGATITTVGASGAVVVQTFDARWNQLSATVTSTLAYGAVEVQDFNGSWTQLDARISTPIDGGGGAQEAFFDGSWNETSVIDTDPSGFKTWTDYGVAAGQTFTADPTHPTTFVFTPGTISGDTLSGLQTFSALSAMHDVVDFSGYGPGAALTQVDATHWQIASTGHASETFAVSAGTTFAAGDYVFT